MKQFSLRDCLLAPLLLVVCVGFIEGLATLSVVLPDIHTTTNQISNHSGAFGTYVRWLLDGAPVWILIAALCYVLGRLYVRGAQIVALFTVISIPLASALSLYHTSREILGLWTAAVYSQVMGAEFTALCVCATGWYLGYRRANIQAQKYADLERINAVRKRFVIAIVVLMFLISILGWGSFSFDPAMAGE